MNNFQNPFLTRTINEMSFHSCSKFRLIKDHCHYLLDLKAKNNGRREQNLQKSIENKCDFNEVSNLIYFCFAYIVTSSIKH